MRHMTDTCTYPTDRDETLVAYLYDDIDAATRTAFEAHLSSCTACRDELESLESVRHRLGAWSAPDAKLAIGSRQSTVNSRQATRSSWLPDVPAWAQAAAAILILGVAAGIANLDIRYNQDGLTVRTGWSPAAAAPAADAPTRGETVSRPELVALEERLRTEVRALQSGAHAATAADPLAARNGVDAEQLRRVRALLDESEKRQQRELALRVGEMLRDINAQRQADLVRIDRSLGLVENNLGVEVLKQRERVNYLMRVNQR